MNKWGVVLLATIGLTGLAGAADIPARTSEHWLWSPNALSTSEIGVSIVEKIGYGWSLIGVVEVGFDPYSGMLINAPRSRADNNVNTLANQTANYDSSAAGQWDNSQGFIGVSNPV